MLFYTDGVTVWNKGHGVMLNGNGLHGHPSSTQSAVVIPQPGNDSMYYIFTVDEKAGARGLCYSTVNVRANGGYGAVIQKNVAVYGPSCEKIAAVAHANGTDFWIITHRWNSGEYVTYKVSSAGLDMSPIISAASNVITGPVENTIGVLKCSSDGKRLAAVHSFLNDFIEILDFDNQTGLLSNCRVFRANDNAPTSTATGAYGAEFSPNNKLLYVSSTLLGVGAPSLKQYDITLSTGPAIKGSEKLIYNAILGSMQLGPDQKIYCANYGQSYLSVINEPNRPGANCNFQYQSTYLGQFNQARMGLPVFIQSYFDPQLGSFTYTASCTSLDVQFNYTLPAGFTSLKWDFGDIASGVNNTSVLSNPTHQFTQNGTYSVTLVRYSSCGPDTIRKTISVGGIQFTLGEDTGYCGNTPVLLTPAVSGSYSFLWQDGSTSSSYSASGTGIYWLEITDAATGCTKRDSIDLVFTPYPSFSLGPDRRLCEGASTEISVNVSGATYAWSTGASGNTIIVSQNPGTYWLDVTQNGCTSRDSMEVIFSPKPSVNLGIDTLLCDAANYVLDAGHPGSSYLWNDNATVQVRTLSKSGTYWVSVTKDGCAGSDTIKLEFLAKPNFTLGPDKSWCEGTSILLRPGILDANYLWQDGSTQNDFAVTRPGKYYVTITNKCGLGTDSINVVKGACNVRIPNAFSPNRDQVNETFKPLGLENAVEYRIEIFNRWGQRVFVSRTISLAWDGTYNGKDLPAGAYYYILTYHLSGQPAVQTSGCVLLLR